MEKIRVKKPELLEKLKVNLKQHVVDYDEAVIGYKKAALHALEGKVEELQNDPLTRLSFNLTVPRSYEKTYQHTICMLEMEVREEIELTMEQFSCFVMDDWDWKESFTTTSTHYKSFK